MKNEIKHLLPGAGGFTQALPGVVHPPMAPRPTSSASAFSLVEVVIALGIAAFCLVAMLGLFPTALKSSKNSTDETASGIMLNNVAFDLRNTPVGSNTTSLYGITLPTNAAATASTNFFFNEDGSFTNTRTALSTRYGVLLTMSNPTAATTTAWIQVYWPPTLSTNSLSNALGVAESLITINRQ
jgi:uncharacterized protein (TIGR02598 family)